MRTPDRKQQLKRVCERAHHDELSGLRRYNQLLKQKAQLEELEKVLKAEQEKMLSENQRHQATAAEYHKLKEENDKWVNSTHLSLIGLRCWFKNLI